MIATNSNLLSPPLDNLSPNIMGRTAKFAVSNTQKNKRGESQQCSGDQGQGTSSSTKMAKSRQYALAHEDPFAQLMSPPTEDADRHADLSHHQWLKVQRVKNQPDNSATTSSVQGQYKMDRIRKEMVTPGAGTSITDDYSSATMEYQYMPR